MNKPMTRFLLPAARAAALVGALIALTAPAPATAEAWGVDAAHTQVRFSVDHFLTPVTGSFDDFEVNLIYDPAHPEKSRVTARIKTASVNTNNKMRDDHLRSGDWFEADKHPYITFESTSVRKQGANRLVALGTLSIKGEKKQVELPIALLGSRPIPGEMQAMLGGAKEVASFKAVTAVNRGDFGVGVGNWASNMVVGSDVGIEILLEAHRK